MSTSQGVGRRPLWVWFRPLPNPTHVHQWESSPLRTAVKGTHGIAASPLEVLVDGNLQVAHKEAGCDVNLLHPSMPTQQRQSRATQMLPAAHSLIFSGVIHMQMHTHTWIHTLTHIHVHKNMNTNTQIHAHTHTYTIVYTNTHAHSQWLPRSTNSTPEEQRKRAPHRKGAQQESQQRHKTQFQIRSPSTHHMHGKERPIPWSVGVCLHACTKVRVWVSASESV